MSMPPHTSNLTKMFLFGSQITPFANLIKVRDGQWSGQRSGVFDQTF
jgi:hypothetical protein